MVDDPERNPREPEETARTELPRGAVRHELDLRQGIGERLEDADRHERRRRLRADPLEIDGLRTNLSGDGDVRRIVRFHQAVVEVIRARREADRDKVRRLAPRAAGEVRRREDVVDREDRERRRIIASAREHDGPETRRRIGVEQTVAMPEDFADELVGARLRIELHRNAEALGRESGCCGRETRRVHPRGGDAETVVDVGKKFVYRERWISVAADVGDSCAL